MGDLQITLDTSEVSFQNQWAREALQVDRKRLVGIIMNSAPPDANEAVVKVQQGRRYDQFSFEIKYGQKIGDLYVPAGEAIHKTSTELAPIDKSDEF